MTGLSSNEEPRSEREGSHTLPEQGTNSDVAAKCIEVTERFRAGVITKVPAIIELQDIIPNDSENPVTAIKALESYVRILDNVERLRDRGITDGGLGSGNNGDDEGGERDENAGTTIEQTKRRRSHSVDTEDESSAKRKIDVKTFAWIVRDEIDPPVLSPSLRQTQIALENFSRDIKMAKTSLLNSPRLPQFPDSEWSSLLSGRAVDLDHVLAGQYSISHDERRTERIGQLEFVVGTSKAARSVDTHGKWLIAWEPTVEATTYIFPHRASELRDYGKHVTQLFASFPESLHLRIIQYDRAVRIRAAQRRDILLTDLSQYSDLHVLWIQNAGGASGVSKTGRSGGTPSNINKRRDPCRRWNEGRCPNTAGNCTYAHICSKCRSNAHTSTECETSQRK